MKFSIIVPAHNSGKTIRKALESVKNQSYQDYELIVICDDCTDTTKRIAKEYTDKVYEVNYHKSSLTRNVGLDNAKGDWILFLDSDDWYLHEYVFEQLANKVGNQDEDMLCFSIIWKGVGYGKIRSPKGTIYPHATNKCWRRSSIGDTRFPNYEVAEDEGFFKEMLTKGIKIVEWDMPLYYYNYLCKGSKSVRYNRTIDKTKIYWSTH